MSKITISIIFLLVLFSVCFKQRNVFTETRILAGDEPSYANLATSLLEGKGFQKDGKPTAWRTPGFPAYLAILQSLTGERGQNIFVSRIVLFLINCSITLLIGWFSWLLFRDDLIAIVACLSWTFLFNSRFLASELLGEEPATIFLLAGFILGIYAASTRSIVFALFSGLLVGIAILTRGYLLPVLLALPVFYVVRQRDLFHAELASACLIGTALVLLAWCGRNLLMMHSFTLSTEGTEQIWIGCNAWTRGSWDGWNTANLGDPSYPQSQYLALKYPTVLEMSEVDLAGIFARETMHELSTTPGRVLWLLPRKAAIFFFPTSYMGFDYTYLLLVPFFIAGCSLLLWPKGRRDLFLLLVVPILSVLLICLLTFGDPRFRHPTDPFIVILASVAITGLLRACARKYLIRPRALPIPSTGY